MRTTPRAAPTVVVILALLASCLTVASCSDEPPAADAGSASCHSSYEGACLAPNAADYDCESGTGDGPKYTGYVTVVGPDDYGLDRDGDGQACES